MNNKIGICSTIGFFVVNFTALHALIPGNSYVRPGLLFTIILILLAITRINNAGWYNPIGKWRLIFCLTIIPGIFIGYGTGIARSCFITNLQDFIGSFLALSIFINSVEKLRLFNKIILITALVLSIYVIAHNGHGPGILVDENDVGLSMVMLFPFAYFNLVNTDSWIKKTALVILMVSLLLAIAITFSRGTMVGIIPTILLIWMISRKKIMTFVCLMLLIIIVLVWGPPGLIDEFKTIGNTNEGTASSRRYFWELSIELFKKRPVFGVGAGCWGNAIWSGLLVLPRHVSNMTAHSVYFQLISELGIMGIAAWCMLIAITIKTGLKIINKTSSLINKNTNNDPDTIFVNIFTKSLLIGLTGGLVCGFFISFLFYPHLYTYIALIQTAYQIMLRRESIIQ